MACSLSACAAPQPAQLAEVLVPDAVKFEGRRAPGMQHLLGGSMIFSSMESSPCPSQDSISKGSSPAAKNISYLGCHQQRWVSERGAGLAESSKQFCVLLIVSFGLGF